MNKKEINVKGCVSDNVTKMPIPGARVTLFCWYHAGWDKAGYVSIDTIADKEGCFSTLIPQIHTLIGEKYTPIKRD